MLTSRSRCIAVLLPCVALAFAVAAPAQNWKMDLEVPASAYQNLLDSRSNEGFMPSALTARDDPSGAVFQVTWVPSTGTWLARHDDTTASLTSSLTWLQTNGYRPVFLESYGAAPNAERFTSLWVHEPSTVWQVRTGLTSVQYQADLNTLTGQGYSLHWVSGNGDASNVRFAGIFLQSGLPFAAIHDGTATNFTTLLSNNPSYRLVSLSTYGPDNSLYAACMQGGLQPATAAYHNRNRYEIELNAAVYAQAGYQTLLVDSRLINGVPRFTSARIFDSATETWRTDGLANPGLGVFDTAMQTYMQTNDIRQGALAVTKNSQLMLARGYSWSPPTCPDTNAGTLFRIASISKPLTSVGILRLVESGRMGPAGLDTLLKDKINLGNWNLVDPRADTITIRHLLHHRGGFNRAISGDPVFNDVAVALALAKPLPISPQDVIDWMTTRPLDFTPGTEFRYSNFGYCLLGRVIEAVSGKSYEDFMYDEVLGPIGAGGMRVTESLFGTQLPGEVTYGNLPGSPYVSVMGSPGPVTVPAQYGAWNQRTIDSAGGWAASALDLAHFAVALDNPAASPLLSQSTIATMFSRYPTDPTPSNYYAMGWLVIPVGNSQTTWHDGLLGPDSTRTFLFRRFDGVNWVLLFNTMPANLFSINSAIDVAANSITSWPTTDLFSDFAQATTFGDGCPSAIGPVRVRPAKGSLARLGQQFDLRVENLPTSPTMGIPFLIIGFSNQTWSGGPLPMSLASYGMPGCFLNVSPDAVTLVANAGGYAEYPLRLPNANNLLGVTIDYQCAVTSPGTNAAGLVTSHGLEVLIGR